MSDALLALRARLDRIGVLLSGLCLIHCVAGLFLVRMLGIGGGVLLIAAPYMASDVARHWIVATFVVVFAFAAAANAYATRGRHFGWMLLSGVVGLAIAGY